MKKGLAYFFLMLFTMSCGDSKELPTVDTLDLKKYMGTWYEIARLPNKFEKDLVCVRAQYSLQKSGKVTVLNRGYNKVKDKEEQITGKARVPNPSKPGQIKVTFFWPFAGDYYVIDIDEGYQTALVGSPDRKYLWILCRTTSIDKNRYYELKQKASELNFDVSSLLVIEQDCY